MNLQEVLLIGGMGYVGRQLQQPLLKAGYRIHVLDKTVPEQRGKEEIEFHQGLLSDKSILREALGRCGTVFYLASDSVPTTTVKAPALEGELNVLPFLKFLDIFQDYRGVHLVYISSGGTVYGNPETIPVDESSPVLPISYHGAGKAAIEAFLRVCSCQFDHRITILRPSNLYGPDQHYVPGFGIIRTMLEKLKKEEFVEIWGDGEVVRDYLYIDDFISACLVSIPFEKQQRRLRIFNISSGQSLSINQLCDAIEEATRRRLKKRFLPGRAIDVKSVILDCSRIKTELGWQPFVEMSEGIKRTWEWICTQTT